MKIKLHFFLCIFFCVQNVFSQNQLDSLKYYYKLKITENERYRLISKKVIAPLRAENPDSLLYITQQIYGLAKSTKNLEAISYAEIFIGGAYFDAKNDAAALRHYYIALKGFETVGNKKKISDTYSSISSIYKRMEDYKKAFEFINKSMQLKEAINEKDIYYYGALIHHANAAKELKDYKTAFNSSKKSLEYFKDTPFFRIYLENNFGYYYQELFKEPNVDSLITTLNIQNKQQVLDSSLHYYKKVLKTVKSLESVKDINNWKAYGYFGKGENAYLRKNYMQAIQYLEMTNSISKKIILSDDLLKRFHKVLYLSYFAVRNYEKSLTNYKKLIEVEGKIKSEENRRALIEQKLVYEHEKQLQKVAQKNKERQKNIIIVFGSFIILLVTIIIITKRNQLIKDKKLQKQFSQSLLTTQEEERKRISEDLHDGLGQSLLLVKNQLTIKDFDKSKDLLESSIEEMRSIVKTLYPFQLSRVGISTALENLITQLSESYQDLDFIYDIEDIKGQLTDVQETNVFRIFQECLSNTIKHAKADSAKASLSIEKNNVKIQIQDNGKGFDFLQKRKELKTLGLKTIKERVDLLNGTLEIDSVKNQGTSFVIQFPLSV